VVAVTGPPGIGKSSLVRAFADRVRAGGTSVYEGRCHEAEAVAYKGIDGAIDMLCADLRSRVDLDVDELISEDALVLPQMFPVLRRLEALAKARPEGQGELSPLELRRRASQGLRTLLTRLAGYERVVLSIDDFQWATDDGARLLLDILRPPSPPILLIITYHEDAIGRARPLDRFLEGAAGLVDHRIEVPVPPLGRDSVVAILEDHGLSEGEADQVLHETGGDPYLLWRALDNAESAPTSADLARVFRAQLDELAAPERQLLELISVSAVPLTQAAACRAAGLRDWSPVVLDRLRRNKLVRSLGRGRDGLVEPYHSRVREIALTSMTDEVHKSLHLRLASFLETNARVDPEILAHHYHCAGARDLARGWTVQAGRDAIRALAFARAAELFRSAVDLTDDPAERVGLLVELADALEEGGRRADAGRVCLEAAELAEAHERWTPAQLRARAGEHLMLSGHFDDGLELVREALAAVEVTLPDDVATAVAQTINIVAALATRGIAFKTRHERDADPDQLQRIDLELATARALAFTDVRAPWISARALFDALEVGEPIRVQRALCHFVLANVARDPDLELVGEAIDAAHRLATRANDDVGLAFAHLARGMRFVQRMDHHAGLRELRQAASGFATSGRKMAREVAITRVLIALVCGNYGVDIHQAVRLRERALADAVEREDMFTLNWMRLLGSWLDLSLGDVEAASENLALAREAWPNVRDDLFVATSLMHEISIELYARPEGVWETIRVAERRFHELFTSLVPVPRAMFYRHWGFAALLSFQEGRAGRDETVTRVEQCADIIGALPYITSLQAVIRAHLACLRGDPASAEAELAGASAVWHEGGQRGPALLTELRLCQLRGDEAGAEAVTRKLTNFGAGDANRFAMLFVGPRLELTLARVAR
jgi:hypothetical protein